MTTGYDGGLVFLEFVSSMSAAKSINIAIKVASALAARKQNRSTYSVEGFSFHPPGSGLTGHPLNAFASGYLTVARTEADGKRRRGHLALLASPLTVKAETRLFLLDGTVSEPSPWFPKIFQGMRVPVLPAWYPVLWTQGIRNKLITKPGVCYGRSVWEVADESRWQTLVSDLVRAQTLQGLTQHG